MEHLRLFIPGPVEVSEEVRQAEAAPMIGHRTPEYGKLHRSVASQLRELLGAKQSQCLLYTSSATGVMEGGIRNLAARRVLSFVNGAFSERWHKIALACGREADAFSVEWGQAITPAHVKEALASGDYDAITLVHNETSTGVMNDLPGIARAVREVGGDDICLMVDAVTSMTAVPIDVDALDLDLCLAGSQKAMAIAPGLTVATVSQRALKRAATIPARGVYFDFLEAAKSAEKDETPSTPAVSLMYALDCSLSRMFAEGISARYARHLSLAKLTRSWAKKQMGLFPKESECSVTLTVVKNTREIDVGAMIATLRKRGVLLADGYGKLKGKTFRISHMGEAQEAQLVEVLGWIDEFLAGHSSGRKP